MIRCFSLLVLFAEHGADAFHRLVDPQHGLPVQVGQFLRPPAQILQLLPQAVACSSAASNRRTAASIFACVVMAVTRPFAASRETTGTCAAEST